MSSPSPPPGSSRGSAYLPVWHDRRRSRRRGGTSNRSSRGSRTTKAPRERRRTRSATNARRRARVRRTTRRNKNTRRALQAKRAMTETKKAKPRTRPVLVRPRRRAAALGRVRRDPARRVRASGFGRRRRVRRALATHRALRRVQRRRKRPARARRGRIPEPPGCRFVRVRRGAVLRPRALLQRAEGSHAHRARERRERHEHDARAAQTNLWRSVLTGDRRLAFEAEEALSVSSNVSRDGPRDGADDVRRRSPCAVYVETSYGQTTSRRDVVWTSAPVPVVRAAAAASSKATARDALALIAASPDGAATDDAYDEVWRCSVQGVDVRLDTPLDALHARMRGADRFLHVCAVRRRNARAPVQGTERITRGVSASKKQAPEPFRSFERPNAPVPPRFSAPA